MENEESEVTPVAQRHPLKFLGRNQKNIKDDYAFTVDGANTGGVMTTSNLVTPERRIRRLTPVECERLQGFPDNWTLVNSMSDSQRYKMMGNAVTVNVIQVIGEKILQEIDNDE